MTLVKAEGIIDGNVFVRRGDGLHLFSASLVREKPVPRKAAPPKALLDSPCNGVRFVNKNGKVTLVED